MKNSKDDVKLPANSMFGSRFLEILQQFEIIVDVLNDFSEIRRKLYLRDYK